ncbi:hypothetical protein F5Y16DRAFT_358896 [Xylariaceae sp. FL0255]|nr:hypothetical protein F5Y16DRAFT_358896 [Xylariaceae sp. FL0255]
MNGHFTLINAILLSLVSDIVLSTRFRRLCPIALTCFINRRAIFFRWSLGSFACPLLPNPHRLGSRYVTANAFGQEASDLCIIGACIGSLPA